MTVKICDFGVSIYTLTTQRVDGRDQTQEDKEFFTLMNDDFLNRLAGTPAFLAAELCFKADTDDKDPSPAVTETSDPPKVAQKYMIDVWALGVTYYCLLFGHPPWEAINEWQVYHKIANEDFVVPETMGSDSLPTGGRSPTDAVAFPDGVHVIRILDGLLKKNPCERLQLKDMKVLQLSFLSSAISNRFTENSLFNSRHTGR
jgi:serine/threonine protein kinase